MAEQKVIVKRLEAIENFGSMTILCFDKTGKTGNFTEGIRHLHSFVGADGQENKKVFLYVYLNATYETGYNNPDTIRLFR
jgi:P-type Mg2+ transporter